MFGFGQRKKITEKLYEQNLELAVKNKTLSLLEKLYQTSVLTLTPEDMARAITDTICKDLNLELAGVLIFKKEDDSLKPLAFSKSERLVKTLAKLGFPLQNIVIKDVSKHNFFKRAAYDQIDNITNNIEEVFKGLVTQEDLRWIKTESHIKTILLYPLIVDREVFSVLLLGLNRDYNTLNTFEKSSIRSFINVIGLLLDKAYLYKNLQASYEVEKRAHAIEKRAKEEIEKLDKVKDQFLMTTQHNLRTPLTSMMGYSDLLLNGTYGKQSAKTTEVIKKFQILSKSMIKMANDFLDAAQFQLGKNIVALKPGVEVTSIVDELIGELSFKTQEKGIYLRFKKPEQPVVITADREKLKAALFNIIDNSIKYTTKGGVNIKIQEGDGLKIIVADMGIGIAPENLGTLFNSMFERGENAKTFTKGSGVGLYLSQQIIQAHSGKVWAESGGEGKGSTFYIELPLG